MQSTVTLNISEYNEILINSTICQQYKEENSQLKEELAIAHKQLEELQQPKTGKPPYTVKLDGSEVYEAVKKATDEVKRDLEKKEKRQLRKIRDKAMQKWLDERRGIVFCDKTNPDKRVVLDDKGIHLYRRDTLISSTTK